MKKYIFMALALVGLTGSVWAAAPSITLTTLFPDTTYAGPYTVRTVIKCSDGIGYVALGYNFNPTDGPWSWSYAGWGNTSDNWIEEYVQVGDTFYFDIPSIPQGLETPVKVAYSVWADNATYTGTTEDPGFNNYYSFQNTIFTPEFSNVTALRDTFFNGPFVIKANIVTAFGDSVAGDFTYSDIAGGADYTRDSLGTDGFYYYTMPRYAGNAQTPVKVSWFMTAYDTMGNWAQYPLKRDTFNWFTLIDPQPSNTRVLGNTEEVGPFVVWTTYKSEGAVINDSLWVFNTGSSTWESFARDSMNNDVYYYTMPQQLSAVINPVLVQWYLKATDSFTGNYTYVPSSANPSEQLPYTFRILDLKAPTVANVTQLDNTAFCGPFKITANFRDTSGIVQTRVYFRAKPAADTAWNYLPMYATGNPDEYSAYIPVQYPGMLIQYYVTAYDGALTESGTAQKNTVYSPAGGLYTPNIFYTGSPQYKLLLVNDGLEATNYNDYYTTCMDSNGLTYSCWDNRKANVLSQLHNISSIVWFTGDDSLNTLNQSDRDSLAAFLDRGGNLLLSSKNLGQNLGGKVNSDTVVFYHNYLKARLDSISTPLSSLTFPGRLAYPISRGLSDSLYIGTLGTAGNYKSIDRISPLPGADSVFNVKNLPSCAVIRCSTGVYKTVYTAAPLEAIAKTSAGKMSRTTFIGRCLSWFGIQSFYKVEGEAVSEAGLVQDASLLYQAYPNPFSSSTTISFNLPAGGQVSLKVYNVLGQVVKTVYDGQKPAGIHKITWNGNDESGQRVSNGIYLYRLVAGDQSQTRKVVVLR